MPPSPTTVAEVMVLKKAMAGQDGAQEGYVGPWKTESNKEGQV